MTTQSTQMKLIESLAAIFQALTISRTIQTCKVPWGPGATHPGIFLSPATEAIAGATNLSDDYNWGVQVIVTTASNRDARSAGSVTDLDALCLDRERMIRACFNKRVLTTPELWGTVEPGPVIDPGSFANNYDVSVFLVRAKERFRR